MAKSKRSRRARRQETQKQTSQPTVPAPAQATTAEPVPAPTPISRKLVNFAEEYSYVFYDLRNVIIISLLMFVVLVGLSFVI